MKPATRIVLASGTLGACLFPSTDGFLGGDASLADASDVAVPDVASDVPLVDGATTDADAATDAPAAPFCAAHVDAAFCADFDESPNLMAGFSSLYFTDGGLVQLDDAASSSPPCSLLSGNYVLGSGASSHACLVANTARTATSALVLDMDIRIDSLASQGTYIEAFAIVLESSTRSSIQLNLKSASTEVGEEIVALDGGSSYTGHTFPAPIAMAAWSHVNIALALGANPRTITASVDGTVVVDHAPLSAAFVVGPADLYVGNAYAPGPSSGARIHYDNVVLGIE